MVAYNPAGWHDFCISVAGASGALLGLAFLAISFNLDAILENEQLPGRAIGTLVFFAYPLGASLLIEVPGLSRTALGIGQGLLAAGLIALATIDLRRWRGNASDPLSWRLTHLVPDLIDCRFRRGRASAWRAGRRDAWWVVPSECEIGAAETSDLSRSGSDGALALVRRLLNPER